MNLTPETAGKAYVVFAFDEAPPQFQQRLLQERDNFRWLILTCAENVEDGLPFWVDIMNPMDSVVVNLGNIVLIGA